MVAAGSFSCLQNSCFMHNEGSGGAMKIAVYGRVSTNKQECETQLRDLREYAAQRGFEVIEEYVDRLTGMKDSRPALNRLMLDAKQRKFDAVLVWKLDRWGRSLQHLVNSLAELQALGVQFISFRDGLDLTTPAGRLQFHTIAAMAEFERSLIVERIKAGLRRARREGKQLGRPVADVDMSKVRKLQASGMSLRAIAATVGWSPSLLCKKLAG